MMRIMNTIKNDDSGDDDDINIGNDNHDSDNEHNEVISRLPCQIFCICKDHIHANEYK